MTTAYVLLTGGVVIVGITALAALIVAGESAADLPALRDEVERLRSEVAALTETLHQATAPETRPLAIVRGVPTDTSPIEAALDDEILSLSGATAYGRHAYREGVHA